MSEQEDHEWIKVPKRYRVTRVDVNRYDLQSTLPLALELRKLADLGPGLRIESKGWGTGAYRVFRVSTEPLGDPLNYEPELVHIPAGGFNMGEQDAFGRLCPGSPPLRWVYLDEYWIGRYPVTVHQFALFVEHYGYTTTVEEHSPRAKNTWRPPCGDGNNIQDHSRHPVTFVSLQDAEAYCCWLSEVTDKTYGLPTRERWEKAARGTDASKYPWGNNEPNHTLCNIEHWFSGTTPVGQFSPDGDGPRFDNRFGCADMVGNVSEWTSHTYTYTSTVHPDCDPDFYYYKTTTSRVPRGASWRMGRKTRSDFHKWGYASDHVGFRVVAHRCGKSDSPSQ
jgi:sulfatase modifying factor 1